MKIGIYADPHVSQSSSIIIGKQGEFSGRLDNLIKSFEWMSNVFKDCELVVCLGDLTDKPQLTAEEITAMSLFKDLSRHTLLVGNHCRSDKSGRINSINIINHAIYTPTVESIGGKNILFLPYNSLTEDLTKYKNIDIIFSHNDIKGYDYGNHISNEGYDISDILDNCKLFINGHLHNGGWLVKDRIVNLGQLSGMNFSSCGGQWEPSVGILDLDGTPSLKIIENPYAYRFKKESFKTLAKLKDYLSALPNEGQYVLQIKIPEKSVEGARKLIDKNDKVVASRILVIRDKKSTDKKVSESLNYENRTIYDKLRDYLLAQDTKKFSPEIAEVIISDFEKKEGVI